MTYSWLIGRSTSKYDEKSSYTVECWNTMNAQILLGQKLKKNVKQPELNA